MFPNRLGKQSSTSSKQPAHSPRSGIPGSKAGASEGLGRRRAVALALAVQFALPMGSLSRLSTGRADTIPAAPDRSPATVTPEEQFSRLFGLTPGQVPTLSVSNATADAFNLAIAQAVNGRYDSARTQLKNIDTAGLNDNDTKAVDDATSKVSEAARMQRNATAELLTGSKLLDQKQTAEARSHLTLAAGNAFADSTTRDRAWARLAALDAAPVAPVAAAVAAPRHSAFKPLPVAQPSLVQQPVMLVQNAPDAGAAPTTMPAGATAPATPAAPAAPANPSRVAFDTSAEDAAARDALVAANKFKKVKQEQQSYEARQLVTKARDEVRTNRATEALRDFQEAVELDPTNEQAKAGLNEVQAQVGTGAVTPGSRLGDEVKAKISQIYYDFNAAIGRADTAIASEKWSEAQKAIDEARVARSEDPTLFTQPQINQFDQTIQNSSIKLQTARQRSDEASAEKAKEDALRREAERKKQYDEDKERTVTGLIQDARQLTDEGKYQEALAVVDHIQQIDPNNAYAGGVKQFLTDRADVAVQRKAKEDFSRQFTDSLNYSEQQKIPYNDILHYSDDWPKISEMRDNEVKEERGENEEDAALNATLARHLPQLRFQANALSDVLEYLHDVSGANIYVDWKSLEAASIAKDAPVTANLRDIKFSKALEIIFKSVQGDDAEHTLGYTLDEGVITISTKKELDKNTVTRRYDINDLLFVAPDYTNAPDLSLQNAGQGQTAGGGGGGGGQQSQSIFGNTGQQGQNQQNKDNDRATRIQEIQKYITDNVDTTSWKDNGGEVGSISSSPLRAILLITQTAENQHKINNVLDSLRASQALQVSIETRFLIVQRNYLEDIGVDADFSFNPLQQAGNARSGYNSSRFSPITVIQNQVSDNSTFRDANGNVVANSAQGSRTLDWISNVGNAAVPGSIASNPADYPNPIVIQGSYLDNFTVSFLIRAVQANQNTTSLTAPRLTLFSGQRAVLIVQTQQAYVSDLTPVVAPGAALFDPQVSTTTATGVVLSVLATVSPDRKYVFLDIRPQLARLRALVPFTISAIVQPVTNALGVTTPSQIVQGTLQLPTIDITEVETSVSVPDGATLLLGGQTLAAETTREQGVPVLSKIPFLKRLFTNRATSQDEQILLILVKPTILIQHEQEQKQFPSLSQKVNG